MQQPQPPWAMALSCNSIEPCLPPIRPVASCLLLPSNRAPPTGAWIQGALWVHLSSDISTRRALSNVFYFFFFLKKQMYFTWMKFAASDFSGYMILYAEFSLRLFWRNETFFAWLCITCIKLTFVLQTLEYQTVCFALKSPGISRTKAARNNGAVHEEKICKACARRLLRAAKRWRRSAFLSMQKMTPKPAEAWMDSPGSNVQASRRIKEVT